MSRIILNYAIFRINYSDSRSLNLILLEKNLALLQSMESRFLTRRIAWRQANSSSDGNMRNLR